MSWLIDLAGKAEHYLEKIDQNTAVVLQNQKEKPSKDVFKYLVFINLYVAFSIHKFYLIILSKMLNAYYFYF